MKTFNNIFTTTRTIDNIGNGIVIAFRKDGKNNAWDNNMFRVFKDITIRG